MKPQYDSLKNTIYFPNLNGLRFIAALLVVIHHIEQLKSKFSIPSGNQIPFVEVIGKLGVVLFFVLSGFLITYLLTSEQDVSKTISIKKFYLRRMLRILPLYFIIILLSLFLLPGIDFFHLPGYENEVLYHNFSLKIILYALLLPNMVLIFFPVIPYASVTWSIGVEEQFYIFWPICMKYIKNKFAFMTGLIILYIAANLISSQFTQYTIVDLFYRIWHRTPLDCMVIGGIFSVICKNNNRWQKSFKQIIFNKYFQIIIYAVTIFLITTGYHFSPFIHYEIYSLLFGIIISNLAVNPKNILSLEFPWLNYLGKISYGLYMYHSIAIICAIRILLMLGYTDSILIYIFSIVATILIAAASYHFIEKKFISLKIKYSVLVSGDNLKT